MKYRRRKSQNAPFSMVIFGCCAVFIFICHASALENGAAAGIEFDALEKDLGAVAEGGDKAFEFAVMNTGRADLIITHLRSLCDCVEVSIDEQTIQPGQSTTLRGIFHSPGRWGEQEKTIIVSSNAPDAPQTEIKIRLVVESGIRVDPPSFSFGEIAKNSMAAKTVKIEAQLETELVIKDMVVLDTNNVMFRMTRRKVTSRELPSGKKAVITEMDIVPGMTASQPITIRSLEGGPFVVTGLDPQGLPATLGNTPPEPLKEHQVLLSFTAPEKPKRFYRGYIYIITNHPAQKRVKIGVNAVTHSVVKEK